MRLGRRRSRSWVRLPWLAHDESPGPYITIPQYQFNKTKQHTPHVFVPDVLRALVVWRQNMGGKNGSEAERLQSRHCCAPLGLSLCNKVGALCSKKTFVSTGFWKSVPRLSSAHRGNPSSAAPRRTPVSVTIPQYQFNKTKQNTLSIAEDSASAAAMPHLTIKGPSGTGGSQTIS